MDPAWVREFIYRECETDPTDSMICGTIPLRWVPTQHMLADVLTKIMDLKGQFNKLTSGQIYAPYAKESDLPELRKEAYSREFPDTAATRIFLALMCG